MIRKDSWFFLVMHFIDITFLLAAYLFSFWFRFYSGIFDVSKGIPLFSDYIESLALIVAVYLIVFHFFHLYKKEQIFQEYYTLFKSALFVFFVFMTFTFIQREVSYSRLFIAISFFFGFLFLSSGRFISNRFKLFFYRHGYFLTRALLISDQASSPFLSEEITRKTGYILVEKLSLQSLKRLESVIHGRLIEEVIIHLPREQQSKLLEIIHRAGYNVAYTIIPNYIDLLTKHVIPSSIGHISVLRLETSRLRGSNILLKRLFDFFFSLAFILLLSPFFILIAFLIKLISPKGSIFYKQDRINNRRNQSKLSFANKSLNSIYRIICMYNSY